MFSSAGLILFPKAAITMLLKYVADGNNADKVGYFMKWLMEKDEIYGVPTKKEWFDIGTVKNLEEARRTLK